MVDSVSGLGGRTRISSESVEPVTDIQKIYDQMRGLMAPTILDVTKEVAQIEDDIKDLAERLKATAAKRKVTQEQLQNHLLNEPQRPERSNFADDASYNAEMESYQRVSAAWSSERSKIESELESLDRAISNLLSRIKDQFKKLFDEILRKAKNLREQVEELGKRANTLVRQAAPEEKTSTLAVYEKIADIQKNMLEKLEVVPETIARVKKNFEGLLARLQPEPKSESPPDFTGREAPTAAGLTED